MLHAVIIDDEPNAIGLLSLLLTQHCPQVAVVASCTSSRQGIQAILDYRPNVVFLDIEMPQLNGFQVLEAVSEVPFALVFVTAYDRFALKAFRYNAIDYLLKPIDTQELVQSVRRIEKSQPTSVEQIKLTQLQYQITPQTLPGRLALPYQNGVTFVEISDIVYCESDDSYTRFHLADGSIHLVTRSLKEVQELLEERNFSRIHRQYLINLNQIRKYVRGEGNYVLMTNGQTIPVARTYRDRFIERFNWI